MLYEVTVWFERDGASYRRLWEPPTDDDRFGFHSCDQQAPFPNGNADSLIHGLLEGWAQSYGIAPIGELEWLHGRVTRVRLERVPPAWDAAHEQDAPCAHCGHAYYRHYDSYEQNAAVGCKYCGCLEFIEPGEPFIPWR